MDQGKSLKSWLERLQMESWNMELLVSGFSIILLIQARAALFRYTQYFDLFFDLDNSLRNILVLFIGSALLSCIALIISLIFHILIRGFWIGAIGLRSVQPEIDFQRLRFSPAFDAHLMQKLPPLDRLLVRLDRIASAIFSFAFLAIFMLVSIILWFVVNTILNYLLVSFQSLFPADHWSAAIGTATNWIVSLLFLVMSVLYLIDTLSIGMLKKANFLQRIYLPVYRVMTTITGSFLYRSIYYHLISYLGVWRSRILLNVFILTMLFAPFVRITNMFYYPDYDSNSELDRAHYDDLRKEDDVLWEASIPSTIIREASLPLFIRYIPENNKTIAKICPEYTPSKTRSFTTGLVIDDGININEPLIDEASPDSLLQCLTKLYTVSIGDSVLSKPIWYYLTHPHQETPGIYTVLDISDLKEGLHVLKVDYKLWIEKRDTIVSRSWAHIPFWKYP